MADLRITELGNLAAATADDLLAIVDAPAGTPVTNKITVGALFTSPTVTTSIIMSDGATIGQAAGPLVAFDDTNNYLEITGCNVGIGTTDPTSRLAGTSGLVIHNAFYPGLSFSSAYGLGRFWLLWKIGDDLCLYESGVGQNWVTFKSGGNVGIGTTSPASLLDVSSTTGGVLTLSRADTSATAADVVGTLQWWNNDTQLTTQKIYANIIVTATSTVTTDAAAGTLKINVTGSTAGGSPIEHMAFAPTTVAQIGFFGATPVARQAYTAVSNPPTQAEVTAIRDSLINLGLMASS